MPKTPVGKFITGAALLVVGIATGNPYLSTMGVNLILGGVAQNIAQNKAQGAVKERDEPIKINFDGEESPLFLVFGQIRVGGHLSFMGTYGTNNKYLGIGITHSVATKAGVNDITDIFLDENRIDDTIIDANGDITSGDYSGIVKIIRYKGTDSETFDTTIADNVTYMSNTAVGKGLARTHIRLEKVADDEAFRKAFPRGVPGISALLQGRGYDPRNDSTNGGSGSERYTDADTWTFTQNPAVIAGTYLIMAQSDGGWGIDPTLIDWTVLSASANRCDELVSRPDNLGGSVNAARHTCNCILDTGESCETNINKILSTMDGSLVTGLNGKVKVLSGEYDVPVTTIDNTWLRESASVTYDTDDTEIYNAVRAHYKEPTTGYQAISCVPFTSSSYESTDGRREWRELDLSATTDRYEAQYLCAIEGRKSRHQKTAVLSLNYRGFDVEVWENVTLDLDDLSLSGTYKVVNWRREVEGPIITVLEQSSTAWDSAFADYTETVPTPAPGLVSETPPTPTGLTATATADGNDINWTPLGSGEYSEIMIERSTTSGSGFTQIAQMRGSYWRDPVTDGSQYYYRIRARSVLKKDVYSAYSSEVSATAKTVADGATKHQHFVQPTEPNVVTQGPFTAGDTWTRWQPPADEPRIKVLYTWDGDSWETSANDTDNTTLQASSGSEGNLIPNGYLTTGDNYGFSEFTYFGTVRQINWPALPAGTLPPGAGVITALTGTYESDIFIPVNNTDWYHAEVWLRSAGSDPGIAFCGFACYDADQVFIASQHVIVIADTDTTLAANANINDTTIQLTSATNWDDSHTAPYVAFDVAADFSDLPNRNVARIVSGTGISGTTVTLTEPLTQAYPAGTTVREHRGSNTYTYTLLSGIAPAYGAKYTGDLRGVNTDYTGVYTNKFHPGTAFVRFIISPNNSGTADPEAVYIAGLSLSVINRDGYLRGLGPPWWKFGNDDFPRPLIDLSDGEHVGKHLDNIGDGSTYGRPLLTRLSGGKPFVDLSESINLGRTQDNIADTATYRRVGAGNVDVSARIIKLWDPGISILYDGATIGDRIRRAANGLETDGTIKKDIPGTILIGATPGSTIESNSLIAKNLTVAGSGQQLGDQRQMPMVSNANTGAGFSASPLTSTDAGSDATITVANFTIQFAFGTLNYTGASLTGKAYNTKYSVYGDDPNYAGGSVTWTTTTNNAVLAAAAGRIWVGDITTTTSGGGGSTGGGGGGCVAPEMFLLPGLRADHAKRGDVLLVPGAAPDCTVSIENEPRLLIRPRVRLITPSGAELVCSVDTPIEQPDGTQIFAAHMHRGQLYTEQVDGTWAWEQIDAPEYIGEGPVVAFSVGNGSFPAGARADRRIMSHNKIDLP